MTQHTQLPNATQAQPTMQAQQPMQGGQQAQGTQMGQQAGQQMGARLEDVETPQQRQALEDVFRAIEVCAFCADQCIQEADPNMIECIRLCEDVTELGATALELVPRQSRQSQAILRALGQAVQACGQECGRHHHAHCQDCAQVLGRAAQSIQQLEQTYLQ